ncbi:MAG TPA: DNA-processing protein DprA [Ilumatobacteraceae bacterium]|nr:DNA-processing protein DprA [Ilumatobacteraceae bacterium]HRB03982.1 DNA-processing protein DprA [Ilumatobacteraceae bacterium]
MTGGSLVASELPPEAYVASLAGFRNMSLHRLGALLRHHSPQEAWQVVLGEVPTTGLVAKVLTDSGVRTMWRRCTRERPPAEIWARCVELDLTVLPYGHRRYPPGLLNDPFPPPVLFVRGDLSLLAGRRVGIVGTRNATAAGREAARSLGLGLGAAGVHVVSGLARGIDGYAHRGVLAAEGEGRPIGIVASGLDVVYPREHRDLWEAAGNCGLLLSEAPPGVPPEPHRFPLRNRIVAALSEVLVVVESRERGGSLITAAQAVERDVTVMAVPGSIGKRASLGTNSLLCDGATPVTGVDDVLTALSLQHCRSMVVATDMRARPRGEDIAVYRVLSADPRTIDGVALALGLTLVEAAMGLARLESAGWIAQADGWFECVGSPLR